jgi:Holliday junction resolvase-like predicted endonuclease
MSRDPDNLYDDDVVAVIEVKVRRNGAMSVAGSINNEAYALAMLDNARDTIKRHNAQKKINAGGKIIIPAYDTGIHQ